MSLGEEQGDPFITAIAWSPPGLALHRRSVLAVLTNNNILSMWAAKSDPGSSESWERVLIVNKSAAFRPEIDSKHAFRIRNFSWAPRLLRDEDSKPFATYRRGVHVLCINDDDANLHVVCVGTPYMDGVDSWQCSKICGEDLSASMTISKSTEQQRHAGPQSAQQKDARPSLFAEGMRCTLSIRSISCSPWLKGPDGHVTVLTLWINNDLRHYWLTCKDTEAAAAFPGQELFSLDQILEQPLQLSQQDLSPSPPLISTYLIVRVA